MIVKDAIYVKGAPVISRDGSLNNCAATATASNKPNESGLPNSNL